MADLPRFPFAKDTISVWKRTAFAEGLPPNDDDEEEEEDEEEEVENDEEDEVNLWAVIPEEERMPEERCCPRLKHLMK